MNRKVAFKKAADVVEGVLLDGLDAAKRKDVKMHKDFRIILIELREIVKILRAESK
jgi:hypothetical protein